MTGEEFECFPLKPDDAPALTALLLSQPAEYAPFFTPFAFDEASVLAMLSVARRDVYMGLRWNGTLIAFFMLRGWDEGYSVPAYGVLVDHGYRNKGLGRLTLEMSKSICRLRGAARLMLKVHPDNLSAKHLYETSGFVQHGIDPKNSNLIFYFEFDR